MVSNNKTRHVPGANSQQMDNSALRDKADHYSTPLEFPNRVTLELTNACNLDCEFCPRQSMQNKAGLMDKALFKKAVDEMAQHTPVALVPFFRGESLLHPRFIQLVSYAKSKGLGPIQMTTNAMLMDEKKAREIIKAGIDFISFSMDTVNADDYESARKGAKYDVAVGNIMHLLDLKERLASPTPETQVSSVATQKALAYKEKFINFWKGKVDRVRIFLEHSTDGAFGSLDCDILPAFDKRLPCAKVMRDMVALWNGDVALCNHDWDRKEPIGNIRNQSISEIWNGQRYKEIRESHVNGHVTDSTCAT